MLLANILGVKRIVQTAEYDHTFDFIPLNYLILAKHIEFINELDLDKIYIL